MNVSIKHLNQIWWLHHKVMIYVLSKTIAHSSYIDIIINHMLKCIWIIQQLELLQTKEFFWKALKRKAWNWQYHVFIFIWHQTFCFFTLYFVLYSVCLLYRLFLCSYSFFSSLVLIEFHFQNMLKIQHTRCKYLANLLIQIFKHYNVAFCSMTWRL